MKPGEEYRRLKASGWSNGKIAELYGVSTQAVQQACGGRMSTLERNRRRREKARGAPPRLYRCMTCDGIGHNSQTCGLRQVTP